ncbi:hypothetical protein HK405_005567 [Cladochytrium tenue]|nr:hypothetical protein HK405_005567 [Cladochytrium tenue]
MRSVADLARAAVATLQSAVAAAGAAVTAAAASPPPSAASAAAVAASHPAAAAAATAAAAAAALYALLLLRARSFRRAHPLAFLPPPDALLRAREDHLAASASAAENQLRQQPRYLVVGGSGGLGRFVVEYLLQRFPAAAFPDGGDDKDDSDDDRRVVVVLDRVDIWQDRRDRVRFVAGDIRDPATVLAACKGCSHVIHTASVIPTDSFAHEMMQSINIDGTGVVLEAAIKTPTVRAFVYTSSIAAEMGWNRRSSLSPSIPLEKVKHFFPYGRSKAVAETLVRKSSSKTFPTAAIRPIGIMHAHFLMYCLKDTGGVWLQGKGMDWVYARDLARAHVLLADALADPEKSKNCAGNVY